MQEEFAKCMKELGITSRHRLLLALSGGPDSTCLAHLLARGGFTFAVAHCNFRLRGRDSEADEQFCRQLAEKLDVQFFTQAFDVKTYCERTGKSVQMAARDLRYEWLLELLAEKKFDHLLTAHHAGDVAETILLNLVRGTGIRGLKGVPQRNGAVLRPLLPFTREKIQQFIKLNRIKYRVDRSNSENKYSRNYIRLNVLPRLARINPSLERTMLANAARFAEEGAIVTDYLERRAAQISEKGRECDRISMSGLAEEKYPATLLHHLLSPYGFSETQQRNILENVKRKGDTGKVFGSATHELTFDRNAIVIRTVYRTPPFIRQFDSLEKLKESGEFRVKTIKRIARPAEGELLVSAAQLLFPLTVRYPQTGDKFRPFGMKGFKLVSDFLREQKLNVFDRRSCRLLVNGNGDIIWVAGLRSDERYRVREGEDRLLKITVK